MNIFVLLITICPGHYLPPVLSKSLHLSLSFITILHNINMRSTNQDLTILAPSPQTRVLALYPFILSVLLFYLSHLFSRECPWGLYCYGRIAKLICTFVNQSLNCKLLFMMLLNVQVCILDVLWCELVQTMLQTKWFFVRKLYISGIFVCLGQYCISILVTKLYE